MNGPRPTGDVAIGVNAAGSKDTRKGLAAMVDIEDGKITGVAFTPTFADEESRPAFLKADDPMFGEIADEIDTITKAAGLSASRSAEHTSELQSLMRNSYAVFCLKKKTNQNRKTKQHTPTIITT